MDLPEKHAIAVQSAPGARHRPAFSLPNPPRPPLYPPAPRAPRAPSLPGHGRDSGPPAAPGAQSGFRFPVKDALVSGALALAGDAIAQELQAMLAKPAADPKARKGGKKGAAKEEKKGGFHLEALNVERLARSGAWGLLFYGPYQHWWYRFLAANLPGKGTANFLLKVAANQFVLAPVVLCSVFAWNLALTGKADEIAGKIKSDLWPTMVRGWAFWVPAASINFWVIPLQHQVVYMSSCGIVWTTYLSLTSNINVSEALAQWNKSKLN